MRRCPSAICLLLAAACALAQDPAPVVVIAPVPGWPDGGTAQVLDIASGGTPDAPAMMAALSPFTRAKASNQWQLMQQPDQSVMLLSQAGNACLQAESSGTTIALHFLCFCGCGGLILVSSSNQPGLSVKTCNTNEPSQRLFVLPFARGRTKMSLGVDKPLKSRSTFSLLDLAGIGFYRFQLAIDRSPCLGMPSNINPPTIGVISCSTGGESIFKRVRKSFLH
jgi:hypothetical protein